MEHEHIGPSRAAELVPAATARGMFRMMIPADVEADVLSVLPRDIGAIVAEAGRRFRSEDTLPSPWPAFVALLGWPDVDPARAVLSYEETCVSLGRMLLDWRFDPATEDGLEQHEQASAGIDQAVRRHLLAGSGVLQIRVLDELDALKAAALRQAGPPQGPTARIEASLAQSSRGWLQSAKGYVEDLHDLRNAVVYTAVVLHLELGAAPIGPELLLALAAAGGCHVAADQHEWMRQTVQANVACA